MKDLLPWRSLRWFPTTAVMPGPLQAGLKPSEDELDPPGAEPSSIGCLPGALIDPSSRRRAGIGSLMRRGLSRVGKDASTTVLRR